jgi:uncharacterized membrane protein (DUF485 family)
LYFSENGINYGSGYCPGDDDSLTKRGDIQIFLEADKMLHEPVMNEDTGEDRALKYRTQTGARLFSAYALIYAVFVVINLVSPTLMERMVFWGLNLAVTYGIGLILLAILMALIYNRLCALKEKELNDESVMKAVK